MTALARQYASIAFTDCPFAVFRGSHLLIRFWLNEDLPKLTVNAE